MYSLPSYVCSIAFAPDTTGPSSHVVTKTLFPQAMGEQCPLPGRVVFHRTFLTASPSMGRFFSAETPLLSGPRQFGQLCVLAETCAAAKQIRMETFRKSKFGLIISQSRTKLKSRG